MAVTCASCGVDQPSGARFCGSCGATLVRICAACGTEASADAAFCSACGASLGGGIGRSAGVSEHEERRVVTVMFADLAGSTALGERIDPEELRAIQGELFELVNGEVERFGGISEKFVGDAVMAVFGVPLSHDDDAERAVRAALAVRQRFPALAREVERRHAVDVGLRMGVNTGEVVAGREAAARGELMVSGDAVNVAARLQQRANAGQVLVGERTQSSTRRSIDYVALGAAEAKGKDAPVAAWEAVAVIALPGLRGIEGLAARMIGREEELAVFRALTARVERERAPQLVTMYGVAGVGKTRLLTEFVGELPHALLLHGRCLPYGEGITYWPLGEAAKGYAGILESDPIDAALLKLASAVERHVPKPHVDQVVEAIGWTIGLTLPEIEGSDARGLLREAWRRFLYGLGREQLAVLVVEDVHWASEPLLQLLEYLTDALADTSVLTICTARPEFLDTRESWGGGVRDSTSIRLAQLPEDESAELVQALVGGDGLSVELTDRIVARAEGNPFYVEEILQMLIDRNAIVRANGGWSIQSDLARDELPDSVHGVIAARIDLLDGGARDALRRCSVMGRAFWPHAVGVDDDVIAALRRRSLVTERSDSTIEGMREFTFKHALTHDVAYSTLPRAERRDLHRQVGGWIEAVAPDRMAERAELAAYHYDRALEYGEDAPEVRGRCFELLLTAGDAALARGASESAERLAARAAELADDPRARALALLGLGRARVMMAKSQDGYTCLVEARREATRIGDRPLLAEILSWLSRASWLTARWDEPIPAAQAAIDALAGLEETPQLARALARLSQLEMLKGLPHAAERAREAIAVALRVGDVHAELNARVNLSVALSNHGVPPDLREMRELVARALSSGDVSEAYRCIVNTLWAAQAYVPLAELEESIATMRSTVAGVPAVEALDVYYDLSHALLVDLPAARWDAVDRVVGRSLPAPAVSGVDVLWAELRGGMAMRRGDLVAAKEPLDELRELTLASNEPQRIVPMAGVVVPFAALTGDGETVREITNVVLALTGLEWAQLSTAAIPRALARVGETELLERVADAFGRKRRDADSPRLTVSASVADGLVALASDRPAEGVEHLAAAFELELELGWRYRAACLRLELAAALEVASRSDEAEPMRRQAAEVLEPIGCVHPF